ncbi:MAG: hypothetical protein KF813_07435 [Trueperaceae bacterium]|nr:hypothetical protein [Trueperaceae bacterium]
MIVVREVFQLHYGKAREAVALAKELMRASPAMAGSRHRILTDLVGRYYTLVMEMEYVSLTAFEAAMAVEFAGDQMRDIHARLAPLVMEGRREVFNVVE